MPAQSKAELLSLSEAEFKKLETLLDTIDPSLAGRKCMDETSIKDVVAHRAYWIRLFMGWYADGQAGKEVSFPAQGYKWNQLNELNARIREKQGHLSWSAARALLRASHAVLIDLLHGLDEDALYGAPMKGAKNHWSTGRWAEAAGASHYRSAAKFVRACNRKFGCQVPSSA